MVPDQGAVQEFPSAGLYPLFRERVHSRHLNTAEGDLDSRIRRNGIEQVGELPVPVRDHVTRSSAYVLKVHGEVVRGLCHPR